MRGKHGKKITKGKIYGTHCHQRMSKTVLYVTENTILKPEFLHT